MGSGLPVRQRSSTNRKRPQAANGVRLEICPPALLPDGPPGWTVRLLDWLGQGWHTAPPRITPASDSAKSFAFATLAAVRLEFIACLDDIPTPQAGDLALRLREARSLRELWHLRADVFNAVSCHRDQREARERLSRLNRHFPARTPRSGFGGFDASPHSHHSS
jgi:hypothetical protein